MSSSPQSELQEHPAHYRRLVGITAAVVAVTAGAAMVGGVASAAQSHGAGVKHGSHHHASHQHGHQHGHKHGHKHGHQPGHSRDDDGGLAGDLASQLAGRGAITDQRNWVTFDHVVAPYQAPLPDGTVGHGAELLLDGATVTVFVTGMAQPGCPGYVNDCKTVDGGFLSSGYFTSERGGHKSAAAAFYANGVEVYVEATDYEVTYGGPVVSDGPILDLATVTQLAQNPVFQTGPFGGTVLGPASQ